MIDTIHLRLYDLQLHLEVLEFLDKVKDNKARAIVRKDVKEEYLRPKEQIKEGVRFMHFMDTGKITKCMEWSRLPSHHYYIAFKVDYDNDYVDFNLSVPKYLYGHNILMFTPIQGDKHFSNPDSLQRMFYDSWPFVRRFIDYFFGQEFPQVKIDFRFLRVMRMDLCFNKVFQNERDCRLYFENLKEIKKKYLREYDSNFNYYSSSIYFSSREYSWKIYLKGPEFKKHDYKKLKNFNNEVGYDYFDCEKLLQLSSRILRYEYEFRTKKLDYLFKKDLFRKGNKEYQYDRKLYFKFIHGSDYVYKGRKVKYIDLPRLVKERIKYVKFIENKQFQFYLESNSAFSSSLYDHLKEVKLFDPRSYYFDSMQKMTKDLYKSMVNAFLEIYNQFDITSIQDIDYYFNGLFEKYSIDKDQERNFLDFIKHKTGKEIKGVSLKKFKMIITLLKTYSWDELRKKPNPIIPDRTYYRYKKLIENLGFNKEIKFVDFNISQNFISNYACFVNDNFAVLNSNRIKSWKLFN